MWTPEKITTLVTAITALVTAIGGVAGVIWHQKTQHPKQPPGQ